MRILSSCPVTPIFLVFLTIARLSSGEADNGIVSQMSADPLHVGNGGQIPTASNGSPVFSPINNGRPISPFRPPLSNDPQRNGISDGNNGDISNVIAENVLQFGLDIAQKLNELDPSASRSEIFSPLSVLSALSLLMLGAKGKSYQELTKVIGIENSPELASNPSKYHELFGAMVDDMEHFDVNDNGKSSTRKHPNWWHSLQNMITRMGSNPRKPEQIQHTINVANGLFVQNDYSLNPDYRQVATSIYDSQLVQLDFQRRPREATQYINSWVNEHTNGKIRELVSDDLSASTTVILASVLYFRGFWETPFFQRSTKEDNFYPDGPDSPAIRVQLMATGGTFPFYDSKEYDCRIIGLPYKGNETTMYVIQPNYSTRLKLRGLMSVLNAAKINELIDNMVLKTTVMVFPKMHMQRTMNMKNMLHHLGVTNVFNMGLSDLSLIGGTRPVEPLTTASAHATAAAATPILSLDRTRLAAIRPQFFDRFNEKPLIFTSRFGEIETNSTSEESTDTSSSHAINKRQVPNGTSQLDRNAQALANLEANRFVYDSYRSDLFVNEMIHKVDFAVDEQGTEAAAATAAYLHRSGTDVVFRGDTPFLLVIRHDPTKLPLFYGIINRPEL